MAYLRGLLGASGVGGVTFRVGSCKPYASFPTQNLMLAEAQHKLHQKEDQGHCHGDADPGTCQVPLKGSCRGPFDRPSAP